MAAEQHTHDTYSNHPTPRVVCAWCELDLGPAAPGTAGTSHGICEDCAERETQVFEAEEAQHYRDQHCAELVAGESPWAQAQAAPRLDLIAHLRERIAAGELGGEAQLRAVARSPRLLEELEDRDPDGGVW